MFMQVRRTVWLVNEVLGFSHRIRGENKIFVVLSRVTHTSQMPPSI